MLASDGTGISQHDASQSKGLPPSQGVLHSFMQIIWCAAQLMAFPSLQMGDQYEPLQIVE